MALIAIVEDDEAQRRLLKALLEGRSHEVEAFPNGEVALAAIDDRFSLVLTDIMMPVMDGVALCGELRKRFPKTDLPVVVVSALEQEDAIIEALDAGASDYISKPYPPALLHAKVKIHLEERIRSASTRRDAPGTGQFTVDMEHPAKFPSRYGHYLLERVLGRGSFGIVYEARTGDEGPPVALKILDRSLGGNRREFARYLREIATLSSLDCETIVQFVAAGQEEGRYYLAMENVPGRSALELIRFGGPLTLKQVLRVGVDVSDALVAIHGEGLVHRDVKPANVLLCADGRAKLCDFGLAKQRGDGSVTSSDELLGTVGYLAPEIIRGDEADRGSDLYSLGVTLYELATGQRAFTAANAMEVLRRVAQGWTAKPLGLVVPGFPADASDLIMKLMAFDRDERLQDPSQSKRRFETLLASLS